MENNGRIFQSRTVSGKPWTIDDTMITPQSQVLSIRLPFGGFIWNRPVAIMVERRGGAERIPILDVTRITTLSLSAGGLALTIMAWLYGRARRK